MRESSKLPVAQFTILAICRLAEPIAYTSVLPYMPEMVESVGVPQNQVGKWVGICGAVFSVSQAFTAVFWGSASDRYGRKPTITAGLSLTLLSSFFLGFSRSLVAIIVIRAFAGLGNGNGGIIRTAAAEMVHEKQLQPRAFSIMPLVWNVGSFVGPIIGGYLSNPVDHYPGLFGSVSLLRRYPYALPNIIICCLLLMSILTATLFLRETLAAKKNSPDCGLRFTEYLKSFCQQRRNSPRWLQSGSNREMGNASQTGVSRTQEEDGSEVEIHPRWKMKTANLKTLFTSQAWINLLECALLGMHSVGFDQLLPVFLHSPRPSSIHLPSQGFLRFKGGFGLDSSRIGFLLMVTGVYGMALQFLVFPYLATKIGVLKCFKISAIAFVLVYLVFPFTSVIVSPTAQQGAALALMVVKCSLTVFAFPCNAILLTNVSKKSTLGTINGLATSVSAIGRTVGPAIGGFMFTLGIKLEYAIMPWWIIAGIAAAAAVPVFWMEEQPAFGHDDEDEYREPEIPQGSESDAHPGQLR